MPPSWSKLGAILDLEGKVIKRKVLGNSSDYATIDKKKNGITDIRFGTQKLLSLRANTLGGGTNGGTTVRHKS
jgi:hypothetical protein